MPRRITEDWQRFRRIISGRLRKDLQKFIKSGSITRRRAKGGKISVPIPYIDIPHFLFGNSGGGLGRGPGKEGDVVGRDRGKGKGNQAGNDPGEGIVVEVDLEDVIEMFAQELNLPELKPKPFRVLTEEKHKYDDISLVGPKSLRHMRQTYRQALKRLCASGQDDDLEWLPGYAEPQPVIELINRDQRFRQFSVVNPPSSNAVIYFARDWSGSMDNYKCDVVSDMCWWLDQFISRKYKQVERIYIGHDTEAEEVAQERFYNYRYGGGTNCSSAFRFIADTFVDRYPPNNWNIYVFYFTDGDNWPEDNEKLVEILRAELPPDIANLVGVTQVMSWRYEDSVKSHVDNAVEQGVLSPETVKTTSIGGKAVDNGQFGWAGATQPSEEDRDQQIKEALRDLLGGKRTAEVA